MKEVASKLFGYALIQQFDFACKKRAIDLLITLWDQMKTAMWKEFVPTNHEKPMPEFF